MILMYLHSSTDLQLKRKVTVEDPLPSGSNRPAIIFCCRMNIKLQTLLQSTPYIGIEKNVNSYY